MYSTGAGSTRSSGNCSRASAAASARSWERVCTAIHTGADTGPLMVSWLEWRMVCSALTLRQTSSSAALGSHRVVLMSAGCWLPVLMVHVRPASWKKRSARVAAAAAAAV
ncbi:hypothetical protein A5784_09920 [Mycobacterium sp. 852013-50091_SCH5140682]|uniref:hypothetical protein n=1 Tax=Mycobacterium sp. 852013-50091_SCH5140682 TaxID=1834109 RepID=UPI0007EC09F0|nr:hypothetical protein [Mycobacterium sp. 852013-50091_SCH5140682]OBC06416.1 hypothetical protein A5784_09920 [Mycobacterium sp. 852013-50091_SCH5140682]